MINEVILSLNNIKWRVKGKTILDVSEFHIKRGEVISLIGPNGAGKSSLMKIMCLLERPDSGGILFEGRPVSGSPLELRRKMAMVFQEPLLLSGTVYGNVSSGLRFRGIKGTKLDERVGYWLESFKISHLSGRNCRNLSGGEAQRVSLARALAAEPEILYLDEPFAALDQPTRQALVEDMGDIIKSMGISAVFVTHNAEELSVFTDRICVMDKGSIIQEGKPEDVFEKPANEVTAGLVGVENVIYGIAGDKPDTILVADTYIDADLNGAGSGTHVKLFIRPENVLYGDGASKNCFIGKVEKVTSLSSQYRLIVNCGFNLIVLLSKGLFEYERIKPGSEIKLCIPPERIHIVNAQ